MPLKQCEVDGKSGWKYGDSGKCYVGEGAKRKAILQGVAIAQNSGEKLKLSKADIAELTIDEPKTWSKDEALQWLNDHNLIGDIFEDTQRDYIFYQTDKSNYEALRQENKINYDWDFDEGIEAEYVIEKENITVLSVRFHKKVESAVEKFEPMIKDESNRCLFGWAYMAKDKDGKQIYDHSGEFLKEENFEDLEMATYLFNIAYRQADIRHNCVAKGLLIESVVMTKEKQKAMGIPDGVVPLGVWQGYFFPKEEDWNEIMKMKAPMFSLYGSAIKELVDIEEVEEDE